MKAMVLHEVASGGLYMQKIIQITTGARKRDLSPWCLHPDISFIIVV
jgi:hypothetical protein